MARTACLALALALSLGCRHTLPSQPMVRIIELQTVSIPTPVAVTPPEELLVPLTTAPPVFVNPTDPAASSALTKEGEQQLQTFVDELLRRLEAWKAWATGQ